jgi:hypothetical protein
MASRSLALRSPSSPAARIAARGVRALWLLGLLAIPVACDDDSDPMDDGGASGETFGCGEGLRFPTLRFSRDPVGLPPGASLEMYVEFVRDCTSGATLSLSASEPGVVSFPETLTVAPNQDRVAFTLQAEGEGTVSLTARATHESGDEAVAEAPVSVVDASVPACDGSASGTLAPGGEIRGVGAAIGLDRKSVV